MKKREKILSAVTGALLLVLLGVFLFAGGGESLSQLRQRRDALETKVSEKKVVARAARRDAARLAAWKKRALPSDLDQARSAYQKWLLGLVSEVRLTDEVKFEPGQEQTRRGAYTVFPFKISGRGSIPQVVMFLHKFYSADHLHQIRRLSIKPIKGDRRLELSISVEAVSLPGGESRGQLSSQPSERLRRDSMRDYVTAISARNLFAAYEEPRVYSGPDPAEDIRLNSIVQVGGRKQAWLFVISRRRTVKVGQGDSFPLGRSAEGLVLRIGDKDIDVEIDDRRLKVDLTETLAQGTELPTESDYSAEEMDAYLDDFINENLVEDVEAAAGPRAGENSDQPAGSGDEAGETDENPREESKPEPAEPTVTP